MNIDVASPTTFPRVHHPEIAEYLDKRTRAAPSGCWEWQGGTTYKGYGEAYHGGSKLKAHRLAFLCAMGDLPPHPYIIRHLCNNRLCCRPNHLAAGTSLENTQDRRDAGRGRHGERNPSAKLTEEQARAILVGAVTRREAREHFGIGSTQYHRIRTGQKWAHLR
jgi:hypothetical protein